MVQLVGTYTQESKENYKEYLTSLGFNEEHATKLSGNNQGDTVITISAVDADSISVLQDDKIVQYPLNKEFEMTLPTGKKVWVTTTLNNDVITFTTKLDQEGTLVDEKVVKVNDSGFTITSTNSNGVQVVRTFKRA